VKFNDKIERTKPMKRDAARYKCIEEAETRYLAFVTKILHKPRHAASMGSHVHGGGIPVLSASTAMSLLGQTEKNSLRAFDFHSSPNDGPRARLEPRPSTPTPL
jgi:hypothetical protein